MTEATASQDHASARHQTGARGSHHRPSLFRNRLSLTLLTLLLSISPASAWGKAGADERLIPTPPELQTALQESGTGGQPLFLPGGFRGVLSDTEALLTAPAHWQAREWLVAGVVAGVAGGLYAYDQDLREWVQRHRGDRTNDIARYAKPFGDGFYTLPALGVLYAYGYAAADRRAQQTALLGVESFLLSGIVTQTLKFAVHRQRPSDGPRYDRWEGPGFSRDDLSFPSGETTAAFSIATVIAGQYGDTPFVSAAAYGIATLTGLARINENVHWASDVFVGAAIGYFTSRFLMGLHRKKGFALLPLAEKNQQGVCVAYRF